MERNTDWVENIWNSKLTYFGLSFLFFLTGFFNLMAFVIFIGVCLVGPDDDFTDEELDDWMEFRSAYADECTLTESMELELIPDDLQDVLTQCNISIDLPTNRTNNVMVMKLKSKSLDIFKNFSENNFIKKPHTVFTYQFYDYYKNNLTNNRITNKTNMSTRHHIKHLNELFTMNKYEDLVKSKLSTQDRETYKFLNNERDIYLKELENITKLRVSMGFHSMDPYDYDVFINTDLVAYTKKNKLNSYNKKKLKNRTVWSL